MDLSLPLSQLPQIKKCNFRGCITELAPDAAFNVCETCRVLYVSERITLLNDPFSSRIDVVKDTFIASNIVMMTAQEVLNWQSNLQFMYLEICKIVKLHGLEPTSKRAKQSLEEQIDEARNLTKNVETRSRVNVARAKETLNKLQKQMKALGCKDPKGKLRGNDNECTMPDGTQCTHEAEAKRIFGSVAPDGELGF